MEKFRKDFMEKELNGIDKSELESKFKEAEEIWAKAQFFEENAGLHDDMKAEYAKADAEYKKAIAMYEVLAKEDNAEAYFKLCYCASLGIGEEGGKSNKVKGEEYLRKAAELGHAEAQQRLSE